MDYTSGHTPYESDWGSHDYVNDPLSEHQFQWRCGTFEPHPLPQSAVNRPLCNSEKTTYPLLTRYKSSSIHFGSLTIERVILGNNF